MFTPLPHWYPIPYTLLSLLLPSITIYNCFVCLLPFLTGTPFLILCSPSSYLLLRYTTVLYVYTPSSLGALSLSFALPPDNAPPLPPPWNHRPYLIDLPTTFSLLKFVFCAPSPNPLTDQSVNQPINQRGNWRWWFVPSRKSTSLFLLAIPTF